MSPKATCYFTKECFIIKLAYIITYGCAQNFSDSERIKGLLVGEGFGFTDNRDEADLILINTCAVREGAESRVFGNIGALKPIKLRRPHVLMGVCGCMMQQEHVVDEIKSRYKHIDFVFGTFDIESLSDILKSFDGKNSHELTDCNFTDCKEAYYRDPPPIAKIPIMYGCNNFCSYCVVPYVRGRERSRSSDVILSEITQLSNQGYKEVLLLGQNVNSYKGDMTFDELLSAICRIDGIERIRFQTSHPKDISSRLINVMRDEAKICNQLHLPIQAGADKVLRDMNRGYTKDEYCKIIDEVKGKIPDIVLSTDIIVGFPTETVDDFEETMKVLNYVRFDMIFSFIYSKRRNTPAEKMVSVLSEDEKKVCFERMLELQNSISLEKNQRYINTNQLVLCEGRSKNDRYLYSGRTEGGKIVIFEGNDHMIGNIVPINITRVNTFTLYGNVMR